MHRVLVIIAFILPTILIAQVPSPRAQPSNEQKIVVPEKDQLARIRERLIELNKALMAVKEHDDYADAAVYAKAAEWMLRHNEWYGAKAGEQTLAVIEIGIKRAKELATAQGDPSWLSIRNKPVILGYVSEVDGSIQPYSLTIPDGFNPEREDNRLDVVLAGRDATKTEVKFIYSREMAKEKEVDRLIVEPYGRGNNAYRWAGETDVLDVAAQPFKRGFKHDDRRMVLRGFSMGGAGSWHLGLHHPKLFAAVSPGAGFTVTKGYAKSIPNPLPEYVERCLHIYDAVDYAVNVSIVPVVAYSGEKDSQIAAAQNIEERLTLTPEIKPFKHLIAPGLEHKQPPEWLAKIEEEITPHLPRKVNQDTRFVTYTPKYGDAGWVQVFALETPYEKAEVIGKLRGGNPTISTKNVRIVDFRPSNLAVARLTVDGQSFDWPKDENDIPTWATVRKDGETWSLVNNKSLEKELRDKPIKVRDLQGPIDDAFMGRFTVVPPEGVPMFKDMALFSAATMKRFSGEWDQWMRGKLPMGMSEEPGHVVLFGDPGCNGHIATMLPKLPITWTEKELIVNGVVYDPKTHIPVLIYPNPNDPEHYVVINSGHTFHDADFKGTNALLFPRLGDWAVLKPTPTKEDPTAAEVVAAGIFDSNWKFVKK